MESNNNIVLALYPNTYGIGYVICGKSMDIIDFGLKKVRPRTLRKSLATIQWLFNIGKPDIIVLRDYKNDDFNVSKRTQRVLDEIMKLATSSNLKIYQYSRSQIRDVFGTFQASTKYEIAKKITSWYPQLSSRTPKYRKVFMAENYNMAIFDAFALAITHEYLK